MGKYVQLIACEDRAGLVHEITGVLFRQNLNITENQEFVDHDRQRFFMRTEFTGDNVDVTALLNKIKPIVSNADVCRIREQKTRRLVLLASEEPHCLGDLLVRHSTGELNAEIAAVISQKEECRELTQKFGLPFKHIPVSSDRAAHEAEILKALKPLNPDYLVLARYMRIFSADFVRHFPERILNIHHSFLPAFIGRDPYQQAFARGVKIIGATAHFVTDSLDEGPIITQDVLPVRHTDAPAAMSRKGQDVEKLVLSRALSLVLEDRVLIDGNRVIVFE
jgi:formyltetrahydrofolate deformylase